MKRLNQGRYCKCTACLLIDCCAILSCISSSPQHVPRRRNDYPRRTESAAVLRMQASDWLHASRLHALAPKQTVRST